MTPEHQRVAVSGVFSVVVGDLPPGSNGRPSFRYFISDGQGRRWALVFDKSVYWPSGSLRAFDRQQAMVEGVVVADNQILVDSIGLSPTAGLVRSHYSLARDTKLKPKWDLYRQPNTGLKQYVMLNELKHLGWGPSPDPPLPLRVTTKGPCVQKISAGFTLVLV